MPYATFESIHQKSRTGKITRSGNLVNVVINHKGEVKGVTTPQDEFVKALEAVGLTSSKESLEEDYVLTNRTKNLVVGTRPALGRDSGQEEVWVNDYYVGLNRTAEDWEAERKRAWKGVESAVLEAQRLDAVVTFQKEAERFKLPTKHAAVIQGTRLFGGADLRLTLLGEKWLTDNGYSWSENEIISKLTNLKVISEGLA